MKKNLHSMLIVWGESDPDKPEEYFFATKEEVVAFKAGLLQGEDCAPKVVHLGEQFVVVCAGYKSEKRGKTRKTVNSIFKTQAEVDAFIGGTLIEEGKGGHMSFESRDEHKQWLKEILEEEGDD